MNKLHFALVAILSTYCAGHCEMSWGRGFGGMHAGPRPGGNFGARGPVAISEVRDWVAASGRSSRWQLRGCGTGWQLWGRRTGWQLRGVRDLTLAAPLSEATWVERDRAALAQDRAVTLAGQIGEKSTVEQVWEVRSAVQTALVRVARVPVASQGREPVASVTKDLAPQIWQNGPIAANSVTFSGCRPMAACTSWRPAMFTWARPKSAERMSTGIELGELRLAQMHEG